MNCKTKSIITKRKAFTLIELLIVIAIIGILFIVLVSKVDFATDKAKATGVQTDFRSFQVAFEQVAKENSGFNTFGWDTGDTNGDRVRNSFDAGDTNQDGVMDAGEVWTGRKVYTETWTTIYSLTNPANSDDKSAIYDLEAAINKNLDPKLHITIKEDLTIVMANQARDPWGNEYYGRYISNATADSKDRGAILIYSSGANGENGSADGIADGLVNITTPGNNVAGKDDYVLATFYTYANGYGEVKSISKGFSTNQTFNDASAVPVTPSVDVPVIPGLDGTGGAVGGEDDNVSAVAGLFDEHDNLISDWNTLLANGSVTVVNNSLTNINISDGYKLVVPATIKDFSIEQAIGEYVGWDEATYTDIYNGIKVLEFTSGLETVTCHISGTGSITTIIFPETVTLFDGTYYWDNGDGTMSSSAGHCFDNCTFAITYKGVVYDLKNINTDAMMAFNSLPECKVTCVHEEFGWEHDDCIWNYGVIHFT